MARRIRTAKSLGQRHDFHYFKRWTSWRLWRAIIGLGIPLIAAAWLTGMAVRKNNVPYTSGPMASVHAVFGKQCGTCHQPQVSAGLLKLGFRRHVEDSACLTCHQAPAHQINQTFTPKCGSCHIEHVGSPHLERTADQTCTQCHSDLKLKTGAPHYVSAVLGFNSQHPEFAPLRSGFSDPGTVKLNHSIHMRAGLKGPNMESVQLECMDCHRFTADINRPWKYGEVKMMQASMSNSGSDPEPHGGEGHPGEGRAYMAAPTYDRNCMGCHKLQFDRDIVEPVPHGKQPPELHLFIVSQLRSYVAQHPTAVSQPILPVDGRIPRGPQPVIARNAEDWISKRALIDEELLWRKTCAECHTLRAAPPNAGPIAVLFPQVPKANIKPVWLPNSVFSHYSHISIDCKSCHSRAIASQETSDVLVPSIKTCQSCHNGKPEKVGQAENGCFLCHQYHQWQNQEPIKGKYSIPQLTSSLNFSRPPFPRSSTTLTAASSSAH
jgi:hypothetical protein